MSIPASDTQDSTIDDLGYPIEEPEDNQNDSEPQESPEDRIKKVEQQVNELVKLMKEKSKEELEEVFNHYDPAIILAARAEKRRRDTQAEYTRTRQEYIATKAEKEKLAELIAQEVQAKLDLSPEQKEELENLKLENPEAWRNKLNQLEAEQKTLTTQKFKELTEEAKNAAKEEFELERRMTVLEDFQKAHPDVEITDELIEEEIPPKFNKQLEKGEITFEEFLQKVYDFVKAGKVVNQPSSQREDIPDLSNISGGDKPSDNDVATDIIKSYLEEVY